jgi:hypothetical protein
VGSLLRILHDQEKLASSHRGRAEPHYVLRQQPEFNRRLSRRADKLMDLFDEMSDFNRQPGEAIKSFWTLSIKGEPISAPKREA